MGVHDGAAIGADHVAEVDVILVDTGVLDLADDTFTVPLGQVAHQSAGQRLDVVHVLLEREPLFDRAHFGDSGKGGEGRCGQLHVHHGVRGHVLEDLAAQAPDGLLQRSRVAAREQLVEVAQHYLDRARGLGEQFLLHLERRVEVADPGHRGHGEHGALLPFAEAGEVVVVGDVAEDLHAGHLEAAHFGRGHRTVGLDDAQLMGRGGLVGRRDIELALAGAEYAEVEADPAALQGAARSGKISCGNGAGGHQ